MRAAARPPRGFTLVETLIAVALAALLAAWIIPTVLRIGEGPDRLHARAEAQRWLGELARAGSDGPAAAPRPGWQVERASAQPISATSSVAWIRLRVVETRTGAVIAETWTVAPPAEPRSRHAR